MEKLGLPPWGYEKYEKFEQDFLDHASHLLEGASIDMVREILSKLTRKMESEFILTPSPARNPDQQA